MSAPLGELEPSVSASVTLQPWHRKAKVISVPLSLSLVQALYYVEIRHRWAVEPLLIILAVFGFKQLMARIDVV